MACDNGGGVSKDGTIPWPKNTKDLEATKNIFNHRSKMCTLAAQGKWASELENK